MEGVAGEDNGEVGLRNRLLKIVRHGEIAFMGMCNPRVRWKMTWNEQRVREKERDDTHFY